MFEGIIIYCPVASMLYIPYSPKCCCITSTYIHYILCVNCIQIDSGGKVLAPEESPYILLGKTLVGHVSNVPSDDICPQISLPLSSSPLRRLLSVLKIAMKHNFIPSLVVIAGSVMALHYSAVIRVNSGCPAVIAAGPAETGKSTAIKSGLSLTGNVAW